MTKDEFERLFEAELAEPLIARGFRRSGKSLYGKENLALVALVRLGGRFTLPGQIAHVVCCRTLFLRELIDLTVPKGFVSSPTHYPFKMLPSRLPAALRYWPQNLHYDYERIDFQVAAREAVARHLRTVLSNIAERVLPWARTLDAAALREQLLAHGENAWCEKVWIEDCDKHLEASLARVH